jgi:serine/threonine-protein kinase
VFRELTAQGRPLWKILDFGVCKLLGPRLDPTITATGLIGTPQYMAPEQVRGERDLDQRADVYALAAIAYRALTGEAPFGGEIPDILRAVSESMPPAPSALAPIPGDLDLALAIGLAKRREQRFSGVLELAEAFTRAARAELPARLRARAHLLLADHPYTA